MKIFLSRKNYPNLRFQLSFYAVSDEDNYTLMSEKKSGFLLLCIENLSKASHLDAQIQNPKLMQLLNFKTSGSGRVYDRIAKRTVDHYEDVTRSQKCYVDLTNKIFSNLE